MIYQLPELDFSGSSWLVSGLLLISVNHDGVVRNLCNETTQRNESEKRATTYLVLETFVKKTSNEQSALFRQISFRNVNYVTLKLHMMVMAFRLPLPTTAQYPVHLSSTVQKSILDRRTGPWYGRQKTTNVRFLSSQEKQRPPKLHKNGKAGTRAGGGDLCSTEMAVRFGRKSL